MQPPVLVNKRQEMRHRQTPRTGLQNERTGVRAPKAGRQKVYDATRLPRVGVGQGLTEEIMKAHPPVGRRSPGNASNQEPKRHGADSRLSPERGTQNGKVCKLQMETVRRDPQKVTPPEGRPDGDQQESKKQGLGRRRGRIRHTALQPDHK